MIVFVRKEEPAMVLEDATDQSQTCRLLALPPELRNQIWHDILVQSLTHENHLYAVSDEARGPGRFCANVLRTCKQINAEGTPILYGENVFVAHSSLLATLPKFLLSTRPSRVLLPTHIKAQRVQGLIRRYFIHVRLDIDPRYSSRQVQESFNNVDELHIEVFQAMYGSCDFTVLKLFEGVRGVGSVKIEGSLGDRKYASWLTETMKLPIGTQAVPFFEEYVGGQKAWTAWQKGAR